MILNLNGVPSKRPPKGGEVSFWHVSLHGWCMIQDDLAYDVEAACLGIHNELPGAVFGDKSIYTQLLPTMPQLVYLGGLNSESQMSCKAFERALSELVRLPYLNHFLYLNDVARLVSAIQLCDVEIGRMLGEFYRNLNLENHWPPPGVQLEDGVCWTSSASVTSLISTMNFIFIRMHSLLDYLTKLFHEIEHLATDFTVYPRLSSSKVLFGARKKLTVNGTVGTLFESCGLIDEVELVRNMVIHDGFLDDVPKLYVASRDGAIVEKFLLMPDRVDGHLVKFKNRSLWYSGEDKINLRLPKLVLEFRARLIATLGVAWGNLHEVAEARAAAVGER
ncbi:hypothetical protein [Caenispirillum bisanense]|uniref:hypothetical protein n=1 Tax=Caenispirillum bisanense TaxID=414052 RepID=UPI0031E2930C